MIGLPYLIARSDWDGVRERLTTSPEQASMRINTVSKCNIFPIHQAVCNKINSVPYEILLIMITAFPEALDLNVFQGACENPSLSREAMLALLNESNTAVSELVKQNARACASIALKRNNVSIVDLFINRYPEILHGDILIDACTFGTATAVERILAAGVHHSSGRNGGLFIQNKSGEDAFNIAVQLYDENDKERQNILSICLQYANLDQNSSKKVMPEPGYPVILAAIGRVPRNILESLLKLNAHEIKNTDHIGKFAILKAINMTINEGHREQLPNVFTSDILIDAVTNGKPEDVQALLEKDYQYTVNLSESSIRISDENALNIAISLYDNNDDASCNILKSCIQYANAVKMKLKFPITTYPTLLAAIGLVPQELLYSIGKRYQYEIKKTDRTGKAALRVVLKIAQKKGKFADQLYQREQSNFDFRLSPNTRYSLYRSRLSSITEDNVTNQSNE